MTQARSVQCSAMTAGSSYTERCRKQAIVGATVCRTHGGAAPQVRRAAAERAATADAERRAGQLLAHHAVTPVTDPIAALVELAGEVQRFTAVARGLVDDLEKTRYTDARGSEQIRAEVGIYERALDRSAKILTDMARLGLDARQVALSEAVADKIVAVIDAILADLNLSAQQQGVAAEAVPRRLLEVVRDENGGGES